MIRSLTNSDEPTTASRASGVDFFSVRPVRSTFTTASPSAGCSLPNSGESFSAKKLPKVPASVTATGCFPVLAPSSTPNPRSGYVSRSGCRSVDVRSHVSGEVSNSTSLCTPSAAFFTVTGDAHVSATDCSPASATWSRLKPSRRMSGKNGYGIISTRSNTNGPRFSRTGTGKLVFFGSITNASSICTPYASSSSISPGSAFFAVMPCRDGAMSYAPAITTTAPPRIRYWSIANRCLSSSFPALPTTSTSTSDGTTPSSSFTRFTSKSCRKSRSSARKSACFGGGMPICCIIGFGCCCCCSSVRIATVFRNPGTPRLIPASTCERMSASDMSPCGKIADALPPTSNNRCR